MNLKMTSFRLKQVVQLDMQTLCSNNDSCAVSDTDLFIHIILTHNGNSFVRSGTLVTTVGEI